MSSSLLADRLTCEIQLQAVSDGEGEWESRSSVQFVNDDGIVVDPLDQR